MESELENLKKKMVDWESTMPGQEEHFKEVLRAQREEILKEVRDIFGRTTDLSRSSNETTVLKEENARLKRELEALKARLRTSPQTKSGSSTPTLRDSPSPSCLRPSLQSPQIRTNHKFRTLIASLEINSGESKSKSDSPLEACLDLLHSVVPVSYDLHSY
ncbi:hypothetical protein L6452_05738 [Arctium lappa]|uniref:Uncharacterized protein n=1 Tax=Arctium lappa TaxID=4217 RepID=A0ACB9EHI8_ARCLA|nr:hypothetical protein L6452_05738 [Arctium lappa]